MLKTPFEIISRKSEELAETMNPNTYIAYSKVWRDFSEYLDEQEVHDFEDMSKSHILKFLKKFDMKPFSYNQARSAIFKILNECIMDYDVNIIFFDKIKKQVKAKSIKSDEKLFLSKNELKQVRESAYTLFDDRAIRERNLLIFDLIYHSMMRVDEIALIQLQDIHMERKRLGIRGKGASGNAQGLRSVHAYIPLTDSLIQQMTEYVRSWRNPCKTDRTRPYLEHPDTIDEGMPLLTSRMGNALNTSSIKKDICRMICSLYDGKAPKNHGPHCIRRSVATLKYKQHKDLVLIQKMLRHTSVETTRRYLSIGQEEVDRAFLQEL